MNALVLRLMDVAISLAQTQLDGTDAANTMLGMIRKASQAYEAQTGQPLDPTLIKPEAPL